MKAPGSTWELQSKLPYLSLVGDGGIPSVGVKSVEIRKNTSGEGDHLCQY